MLTFDTIRELERTERDTKKLEKLPEDLLAQLQEYLRRKEDMKDKTSTEILEFDNVKNTIKRFFELRERKISNMALDCVKTGIPPENLTKKEEETFYKVVDVLKGHREEFFQDLQKESVEKETNLQAKDNAAATKNKTEPVTVTVEPEKQYMYKIKKNMPAFVGSDMKTYELKEDETLGLDELPKPLNDLLRKEGVIEKIEKE